MGAFSNLRNIYLASLTEAADDEEKKKKEQEEKEKKKNEPNAQSDDAESGSDNVRESGSPDKESAPTDDSKSGGEAGAATPSASGSDNDVGAGEGSSDSGGTTPDVPTDPMGDSPEGDELPVTDVDGSGGDDEFSMDGSDGDSGENPDGLPSPDDDGSSDLSGEDGETNVQVNVVKLSKLDRQLAKKQVFSYFASLQSTIQSTLNMIDNNETVIEAEIRTRATEDLNTQLTNLKNYLKYKFPIANFEEALEAYFLMVRDTNRVVEHIRLDGITKNGRLKPKPDKQ